MKKGIIITLVVVIALGMGGAALYLTYWFVRNFSDKIGNSINSVDKNVVREIENEILNEIDNEFKEDISDTSSSVKMDETEANKTEENKTEEATMSEEEARSIGDPLYKKASLYYWGRVETTENSIYDGRYMEIANISELKNFFSTRGFSQFMNKNEFISEIEGKYYRIAADRGGDISYLGREPLKVVSIDNDRIVFNAVEKYITNEDEWARPEDQVTDIRRETNQFIIVKENGTWKVEDFTMPD